jgi:hypothetical protein
MERTDKSTEGQIFSDPDDRNGNERKVPAPLIDPSQYGKATAAEKVLNQPQSALNEAKQVMDDEGGANQAGMKQQQVKDAQNKADQSKKSNEPEQSCGCG